MAEHDVEEHDRGRRIAQGLVEHLRPQARIDHGVGAPDGVLVVAKVQDADRVHRAVAERRTDDQPGLTRQ